LSHSLFIPRRDGSERPKLVDAALHEAIRLYGQGWSLARVGDHFGVGGETVRRALRLAGVPVR